MDEYNLPVRRLNVKIHLYYIIAKMFEIAQICSIV